VATLKRINNGANLVETLGLALGVLLFMAGLAVGVLAITDAAFSRGSGEWDRLGPLLALLFEAPIGLLLFALALTQGRGRQRTVFVMALIVVLVPPATEAARRAKSAIYRRQLEKAILPTGNAAPFATPPTGH
jgi:hypothetical protein